MPSARARTVGTTTSTRIRNAGSCERSCCRKARIGKHGGRGGVLSVGAWRGACVCAPMAITGVAGRRGLLDRAMSALRLGNGAPAVSVPGAGAPVYTSTYKLLPR